MLGFSQLLSISLKSGAFTHSQGINTAKGCVEIMKKRRKEKVHASKLTNFMK
jgi:hypothetical protein